MSNDYLKSLVSSATAEQVAELRLIQSQSKPEYQVGDRVCTPVGDDGQMVEETIVEKIMRSNTYDLKRFIGDYMNGKEPKYTGEAVDDSNDIYYGNEPKKTSSRKKRQACFKYKLKGFRGYRIGRWVMPLGTCFGPVSDPTKLH